MSVRAVCFFLLQLWLPLLCFHRVSSSALGRDVLNTLSIAPQLALFSLWGIFATVWDIFQALPHPHYEIPSIARSAAAYQLSTVTVISFIWKWLGFDWRRLVSLIYFLYNSFFHLIIFVEGFQQTFNKSISIYRYARKFFPKVDGSLMAWHK